MIQVHDVTQGTPEWHALREGKYTGSNAHKLLRFGKIPYSQSQIDSFSGNFYTRRGHTLEDEAIELYEKIKGIMVGRPGFITNDLFSSCGYSPDGLTEDRTVEVKAFNPKKHLAMSKELSFEILSQVFFGQVVCEKNLTDVLLYNPDIDADKALYIITVNRVAAIHKNIKRIISEDS